MRLPFLSKITSLPAVAMGAAAGMLIAGVLALVGGSYAHSVVRDQLAPQKIHFAPASSPELPANIKQYAGKAVLDGSTARVFANQYIAVHLNAIAGGQTYAQVSAQSLANPTNTKLAQQAQTLFRGETLRGLLLNAWGWSVVGTVALAAGWALLGLGLILFALPLLNSVLNRRTAEERGSVSQPKGATPAVAAS